MSETVKSTKAIRTDTVLSVIQQWINQYTQQQQQLIHSHDHGSYKVRELDISITELKRVEELVKKIPEFDFSDNWISVKDRLPDKVCYYLTFTNKSSLVRLKRFCAIDIYSKDIDMHRLRFLNGSGSDDKNVTHWQPLPEPPEVK